MKKFFLLSSALLLIVLYSSSQPGNVKIVIKKGIAYQYQDFIVKHDTIWALTADGRIRLLRADTGDTIPLEVVGKAAVTLLAMDKQGNIVTGNELHAIERYDQRLNTWIRIASDAGTLHGITFDSNNNCFLLTDTGIVDISSRKVYFPDSSLNYITIGHSRWFKKPVYLMDSHDNLWIGFGYGEWGGDLVIFNCKDKKFIQPGGGSAARSTPVKSIFEGAGKIVITAGLMHLGGTRGRIFQFDQFVYQSLLNSSSYWEDGSGGERISGEYIGPGAWNPVDKCIYFYSQNGLFKGDPQKDLAKVEYWTKVAQPKLRWSEGQPDAVGSPMNVLKMIIDDSGRLFFLSKQDGIGILAGKSLIMVP